MAFRRFKRHPHALYKEYEEPINLTIELGSAGLRRKLKNPHWPYCCCLRIFGVNFAPCNQFDILGVQNTLSGREYLFRRICWRAGIPFGSLISISNSASSVRVAACVNRCVSSSLSHSGWCRLKSPARNCMMLCKFHTFRIAFSSL